MTAKAAKAEEPNKTPAFKPKTEFTIKIGWPAIYPEHRESPFEFDVRTQLVKEAETLQREFLMMPDAQEQELLQHQHDVAMLGQLTVRAPRNIPGFPDVKADPVQSPAEFRAEIAAAYQTFFMPDDPEAREGMRFIVRNVMSRYWQAVLPADYL